MTLPIPVPSHFRIIAHRGASAYAPENTLAAFRLALEMGVPEVELDTQLTTDGRVALVHDRTLRRYGHGEQTPEEMSWGELATLDMGSWFSPHLYGGETMMTLAELFAAFGDRLTYHIELKGQAPGLPAAVQQLLKDYGLHEVTVITSFSHAMLVAMRKLDHEIRLGWLVRQIDEATLGAAEALQLFQLCPMAEAVTAEMVEAARRVAPGVRAWGLNGATAKDEAGEVQELIRRVVDSGCDGMTINWPDWVKQRRE